MQEHDIQPDPMAEEEQQTEEITAEAAAEVAAEMAEAQAPAAEQPDFRDKYLRLMADMENLRKRTAREVDDARKYGVTNFAREMLGVKDNLERALAALEGAGADKQAESPAFKALQDGVKMVEQQLEQALERFHVTRIQAVGEKFNPELHQAMFEVPTADQPEGTVVQEVQAGYTIAGRLLRPAMVGTAKAEGK